ncbi:TPA: proQ/FINO family protein, partial [Escherichia coli]
TAVAGIARYGLDGLPAGQVSECEAQNARRWLAVREKQKLKMKTMQEQTASTEKIER